MPNITIYGKLMKIPDKTKIQSVDIRVSDLKNSLNFYSYLLGFKVIEEDYTHKIVSELVEKYCLAPGEIIPVCFK